MVQLTKLEAAIIIGVGQDLLPTVGDTGIVPKRLRSGQVNNYAATCTFGPAAAQKALDELYTSAARAHGERYLRILFGTDENQAKALRVAVSIKRNRWRTINKLRTEDIEPILNDLEQAWPTTLSM